MGLIKAGIGAAAGVLGDQWRDYFYCEALRADVLAVKGQKRNGKHGSNKKGEDNIITNGSIVAINDGQCMVVVDQGKVAELCAEPGEFVYDQSTEPSIFYGNLSDTIKDVFQNIGLRLTFGGAAPKDQRVYFFNTKEIPGNKYGTANPVPFRVVDKNIGLDVDISIRCHGEYSYKITNPILFYTNVTGNIPDVYTRDEIEGQMKTELMTALQPAFARISDMGVRYSALPGHTTELADALNGELSPKWRDLRGIEMVSVGVSSVTASEEDEKMIKELQKNAVFQNPNMAAAQLVGAQAQAMQDAAKNTSTGPMMAFAGMNAAAGAGGANAAALFNMGQQQAGAAMTPPAPTGTGWTCEKCNHTDNAGKFCSECGAPMPTDEGWHCACGTANKGKFCQNCGKPKPAGASIYKCDKCGFEPQDPASPPKFCPQCGDPFDDGDKVGAQA